MFNSKIPNKDKYDLEERTAKFGEEVIRFCQELPQNEITRPIINQLIKCAKLWVEAKELNLIFNAINNKLK